MRLRMLLGTAVCLCLAQALFAQDPVKVDPKHYSVISENDQVRILKAHYGPHEKSVMHSHPASVAVFLSDGSGTFHMGDGSSQPFTGKAGTAQYNTAQVHQPENGDTPMDVIVVELKGKGAGAAKSAAKPAKSSGK